MSKLGLSLAITLLKEPSLEIITETGIDQEMLKGTDKKLFVAITKHFREYGKMPEWETLLDEVDFDPETLPKPKEPAGYYAHAIIKNASLNAQREWMHKQAQALKDQDPEAFVEAAKGCIREANDRFRMGGGQIVDLTKNGAERVAAYERLEGIDNGITGIRSPWDIMDEATMGWNPGDLITVVGRTGTGKTWDAILNADHAHSQGYSVGFISMEMPLEIIGRRRDAIRFKLPYNDFKRGKLDQEAKERWKAGIVGSSPEDESRWFLVGNDRIQTVEDIELFVEQTRIKFLVIDGAYLIQEEKARNDWERVTRVWRKLRTMTLKKKYGIATLVTTQSIKGDKKAEKKRAVGIDDTAFGDTINQESAIVKNLFQDPEQKSKGEMSHRMSKNREGQPLDFVTEWDFETMSFSVLEGVMPADEEQDDAPEKKRKGKSDEDIPF